MKTQRAGPHLQTPVSIKFPGNAAAAALESPVRAPLPVIVLTWLDHHRPDVKWNMNRNPQLDPGLSLRPDGEEIRAKRRPSNQRLLWLLLSRASQRHF